MNTEIDLMAPRIKVTGLYPGCDFEMGEVIHASLDGRFMVYEDWGGWEIKYELYPHLFQPLPWYAEREESQMPEYLKFTTARPVSVEKVSSWALDNKGNWWVWVGKYVNGLVLWDNRCLNMRAVVPATKEEFEDYQTFKKQNV